MDVLNLLSFLRSSINNSLKKTKLKVNFLVTKNTTFNFELIERYFKKKNHKEDFQVISERIEHDLDLNEIFKFIDRTSSKIGQQFLYDRIRALKNDFESNNTDEITLKKLERDKSQIRAILGKLSSEDAYYISCLFQDELLERPTWFYWILVLANISFVNVLILPFVPVVIYLLIGLLLINTGIHYWNKKNLVMNSISIPQVLLMNNVAKELYRYDYLKYINPNLTTNLNALDKIKNQLVLNIFSNKLQNDIYLIFWLVVELLKTLFLIEPILLFSVLSKIKRYKNDIKSIFEFVGKVDSLCSISDLRCSVDTYSIPSIISSNKNMEAIDLYHPLIKNCVRNSISIQRNSILLTGSNMSGKTSFIRTIGINYILGHTINTCFADSISFPVMHLHTSIRISDDLLNEKSYYLEEVLTIKEMINNKSDNFCNLYLLDEILKGTNTIERIAAGKAILSNLNNNKDIVFAATHDIELTDMLKDEYDLFHFSEIVMNNSVAFDYKLKYGKLTSRNAIRILELYGFPNSVIKESYLIAKELNNEPHSKKQILNV